ncbi:leucine-rich repeat-containing G-protein coupled receptor 4-like [Mercenaria mercenaria]|uniref:leucine-rich repeat-containing G-protein coupled receptor 4-like n=1 Tax=Mercenaria mercenaria TaxID=6596 RepID=UPI00234E8C0B|nr:leucine-rich repeat-containing G-protein coupled receptor 4-like [Mercenaria mercenaria]
MLFIAIFSIAATISFNCEAFLLGNSCLAPAPCTCSGSGSSYAYISCDRKSLNTIPHFFKADKHVSTLYVQLISNHLTTIPNYAFKNLSTVNATSIRIKLLSNEISTIDRYAFSGIENVTYALDLQNNNLSSIPMAVYNLPALANLYMKGNPLNSLDVFTQSKITNTLKRLNFDLNEFSTWPNELRLLHNLKSLVVSNINFTHLSSEAFQGFEHSLTMLDMQYAANFETIPDAVCHLSNLQSLSLQFFTGLNENSTSIFDHCTKTLNKVNYLDMGYNKLTKFPDVFHIFPSLTSLHLYQNALEILESEKIPTNNVLSDINLSGNRFKRIPDALNKLQGLTSLDLSYNDISSVEDHDLIGLVHLGRLYLRYNPVKYISTHAFKNNNALTTVYLSGTSLKSIPAAVMSLKNLSYFDFRTTDPIPCTCEMSYLKGWNATAVRNFYGECAYFGVKIQSFIMSSLQQCP